MSQASVSSELNQPSKAPSVDQPQRAAINWRSVLLGLLGVVFICAFTPYNDYALNNTAFIGNNLPLGLVVLTFAFVLLVNAPLLRWAPRYAFSSGELAVAFSMALVSCCLPSSGLMRYFPPSMIAPYHLSQTETSYRQVMEKMNLPQWIFPTFESDEVADRINDPLVRGYYGRWPDDAGTPPYAAWITPALAWGILIAALYGAIICMMALVRRQWFDNERLAFPLVNVQLALIEAPAPGQAVNRVLRARSLWVAVLIVVALRIWNGAAVYLPAYFPEIPLGYDLSRLFTESPFRYLQGEAKAATIYFIVVGITYFVSSTVAFSLWAFFILDQFLRMGIGATTGDPGRYEIGYQHMGAILAFGGTVLWLGRRHWMMVLAQALRGPKPGEPQGRYMSYRFAVLGLVVCTAGMITWLCVAGCTFIGATVIVLLLLFLFLVIARVVAETGLVYGQILLPIYAPWQILGSYGWTKAVPLETFFHSALMQVRFYDFREPLSVYGTHALKISDRVIFNGEETAPGDRRTGRMFLVVMGLALVVGYFVSFGSTLATEYAFEATQDAQPIQPISLWGSTQAQDWYLMTQTVEYDRGRYNTRIDPLLHIGIGMVVMFGLWTLSLHYTWWPLHPVGFLMLGTTPGTLMWFSIFIGWACKVILLRLGGATAYRNGQPFFIGLILGECVAAGFWLLVSVVLNLMGETYRAINLMPI